ncbi:cylicin-1 [Vulpes vulpes]|uniref:Cylicin-1 n=1 Tax=Vulpes vulpes TaxID=9627 RepID=A0A3Q7TRX8_VULVU
MGSLGPALRADFFESGKDFFCCIPKILKINIRTNDNSISISESSKKIWNQDYFPLTFPKPLQPGRKKRSRPSESQITVPRHDKRKLEEIQKPAHIRIRHSSKKISQRPSVYLTVRRQAQFRNPYTLKAYPENGESKKSRDDKKGGTLQRNAKENKSPCDTTTDSKTVNDEKPRKGNKAVKTPSKLSCELYKKSKSKLEINPESNYFEAISMYPKKDKRESKNFKETDNDFICAKKDSKDSQNNSDAKSQTCSKNSSNMDFILYLEESGAESMKLDMWLKNYSQNNSKKPSKKDTKKDAKSSDAESVDSKDSKKDVKKDKKGTKKDKKKDSKKDTESTDAESVDSKDAKKEPKKAKKDSKKSDKKRDAKKDTETTDAESADAKKESKKAKKDSKKNDKKKDTKKDEVSTDAESESELETTNWKKDEKKDKIDSKKDEKKKDAKKDEVSTDADSESEWNSEKGKQDEKKDKRISKKDKNKSAMKYEESTETESDWESKDKYESKKIKKDSKKDAKKQESTDAEYDEYSKRDSKKPETFKSSDAESEESLYKLEAKKKGVDESDATSADSKKETLELKREFKMSSKKTTFKEKGKKTGTGRVPPLREKPPLPPCEPLLPSPKIKRLCRCKMPPEPLKPRYAPLIYDLLPHGVFR